MKRQDFQRLADARLADAKLLLSEGRFDSAYYLAGYAVECGLKACAARLTIFEFQRDKKPIDLVYTHNLSTLIDSAGLRGEFDLEYGGNKSFEDNWGVVKLWTADSRYVSRNEQTA